MRFSVRGTPFCFGLVVVGLISCSPASKIGAPGPSAPEAGTPSENPGRSFPGPGPRPSLEGAESSASAPAMPYVPSEPFEYRCQLTWTTRDYHPTTQPSDEWYSSAIVLIDNAKTFYWGDQIKWAHFFRHIVPGTKVKFATSAALPPYPLEGGIGMSFGYPGDDNVGSVSLSLTAPTEKNDKERRSVSTRSEGKNTDKAISLEFDSRIEESATGISKVLNCNVTCTRTK